MEPRFVTKEFALVGVESPIDFSTDFGPHLTAMWDQVRASAERIAQRARPESWAGFWHMKGGDPADPESTETWYFAGVEVDAVEQAPEGLMVKRIPSSRYAVFREGQRGTIGGPGGLAYNQWLPQSGFELNDEVTGDLEVFSSSDTGAYTECDIYIPVRQRSA